MARRRFHRSAPDRGWIVGQMGPTAMVPTNGADDSTRFFTLFDFADIDPESLGRIDADKSDWFIKRVILDIGFRARLDGLNESDVVRFVQWGMGTIGVENGTELEGANSGAGFPVIGAEAYNLWSRLFQTGVMPAYHLPVIPYAIGNPSNEFGVAIVQVSENDASGGGDPAGWTLTATPYGSALQHFDFTVSNAGLRNNQVCGLAFTLTRGPLIAWEDGDACDVTVFYRVLMQKRRA